MKRTAKLSLMAYTDVDGLDLWAFAGDEIDVHPDHVERFDSLNVLPGEEPAEPEPAKKPRARKSTN